MEVANKKGGSEPDGSARARAAPGITGYVGRNRRLVRLLISFELADRRKKGSIFSGAGAPARADGCNGN